MYRSYVYDIESITINAEFYKYPTSGFWGVSSDDEITKWIKLNYYEDRTIDNYLISLSEINLYNLLLSKQLKEEKNQIYFAGCFRYMINSEGKKYKSYNYYTIFDIINKKLYVFEYKDK